MEVGGSGASSAARQPLTSGAGNADLEAGGRLPLRFTDGSAGGSRWSGAGGGGSSSSSAALVPPRAGYGQPGGVSGFSSRARASRPDALERAERGVPPAGLRKPVGGGGVRRVSSPIRTTAEARRRLQESLNADGEAKAVCIGAALDLVKLANSINVQRPEADGSARRAGDAAAAAVKLKPSLGLDMQTEVARKFGIGENLVLQLKLFKDKDLFAFRYGCIVCWNFTASEYGAVKERLRPFVYQPEQEMEEESMEFVIKTTGARRGAAGGEDGNDDHLEEEEEDDDRDRNEDRREDGRAGGTSQTQSPGAVKNDQIILSTLDPLERLAHSYALAQSVRLAVFEIVVDRSIATTRSIPETMATTGEVTADPTELSKQMGQLLVLRCDVNLHTDILDTPDIFWDEEQFEPHYVESREYLEIDKRVEILNQRLVVLKDLYDLLQNGLNVKHGNKLEWIIIILILVEVVLELLELLHDAWSK
eukprot:TRINITY_DN11413_c0_g2_i1.p1 TRINITY_DN11413_c0_g2~~TRINITY_DN11413_c0_g2_i1.p1  ORF type:complete len:496 (-),score=120.63 TRINITY_DN11413_c0_g2_i1:187-1620(-)